jgi:hypothetical protein
MTRAVRSSLLAFAIGCAMNPPSASSSPPAAAPSARNDALTQCLVHATTRDDSIHFAQWMFAIMSLHPDVSAMSRVTDADRAELSRTTGELYTNLLTKACGAEARETMRVGGMNAIQDSFRVIGEGAMRELVSNPNVAAGFSEIGKYVDGAEVTRVLMGSH